MEMKGTNESEKKMGSDAENLQTLSISVLDDKIRRKGDQRKKYKKSSKPRESTKFLIALGMKCLVYRALRKVPIHLSLAYGNIHRGESHYSS